MKDQNQIWNQAHLNHQVNHSKGGASSFAKEIESLIPKNSKVIEFGCGNGVDAAYFAECGHNVLATDFSESAIDADKKKFGSVNNLSFQVFNLENSFNFDNDFDLVYARLSLHYFVDQKTKEIFGEISNILSPSGIIAFICKSTKDPLYGKGREIEKDMYEADHIRHFFSKDYALECLGDRFRVEKVEEGEENFYNSPSAYVKVIARRS
ncbi:MAG TPA: class I SAM-dependent methyltransferase [Patescibacteria group bacterium]|nr:class I SAM-dependent methyltransferase [Patescibacteria group bacterium]